MPAESLSPSRCSSSQAHWEKLRLVRHERSSFEGRFFERHPDHWPIARAATTFAERDDWPDPSEYGAAFASEPPVRFERAPAKRRRSRGEPVVREELYDAMIVRRRVVSTRARMWHDYLNALVWATFPRAKLALHTRQHHAIERWLPAGATQLPNARTRELDALALVDEGGVIVLDWGSEQSSIVFGHALFEGLVFGQPAMIARSVVLDARGHGPRPVRREASLELADGMLAELLSDESRVVSPDELPRRPL
jgi:hypothetical protein